MEEWIRLFTDGMKSLADQDNAAAAERLSQARLKNPREPNILANLGQALMDLNQLDEATEVLEDCLAASPTHHDGLLNRGVVEMRRGNWREATTYFERLLTVHPLSFVTLRNSGNCYARLQDLDRASECFERALQVYPGYVNAKIDLALIHFAAGRLAEAREVLEEVERENPFYHRAREMKQHIERA